MKKIMMLAFFIILSCSPFVRAQGWVPNPQQDANPAVEAQNRSPRTIALPSGSEEPQVSEESQIPDYREMRGVYYNGSEPVGAAPVFMPHPEEPMPHPMPVAVQPQPVVNYAQQYAPPQQYPAVDYDASLQRLSAEIEQLRSEVAKKANKPAASKNFTMKIGGRFFMDYVSVMDQNADSMVSMGGGDANNWVGFREARLTFTGTGYDFLDYKFELGFEKNNGNNSYSTSYKDMYFGIKNVPLLNYVRIGHQYVENAGSEICNGTTNYTFMEAPAPAGNQFTSRRLGISSRHMFANDRGRFFMGAYSSRGLDTNHYENRDSQGIMLNARLTYAPMFRQEGRCMFLYGAYYSYMNSNDNNYSYVARAGGWGLDLNTLQSGNFYADAYHKAGAEAVYQNGQFCLQGELFVQNYTDAHAAPNGVGEDLDNFGGFVMARYFLTPGDFRKYNRESGCWGGVNVRRPFMLLRRGDTTFACGPGAWEIAAMYGFMDTDEFGTLSGTDQQIGLALNWYWNPQVKWCLNYIHQMSDVDRIAVDNARRSLSPTSDILGLSCRIAF